MISVVTFLLFRFKLCQENSIVLGEVQGFSLKKNYNWGNVHRLIPFQGIKGVHETKKMSKESASACPLLWHWAGHNPCRGNPWGCILKGRRGVQKFSIPFLELLTLTSSCITFFFLGLFHNTRLTKTFLRSILTNTTFNTSLSLSL